MKSIHEKALFDRKELYYVHPAKPTIFYIYKVKLIFAAKMKKNIIENEPYSYLPIMAAISGSMCSGLVSPFSR